MPEPTPSHSPDDLQDLFSGPTPSDLYVDPAVVVAGGRRRVRHRRALAGALSSVTAASAVALAVAVGPLGGLGTTSAPQDADRPSAATQGSSDPLLGWIPPMNEPCAAPHYDLPTDTPGATPLDAVERARLDATTAPDDGSPWRQGPATGDTVTVYRNTTWVTTTRTPDGWLVKDVHHCPGPVPTAPPRHAAPAQTAPLDAARTTVRLSDHAPDPTLTVVQPGLPDTQLRRDHTFRHPNIDVRAYRGAGRTVLLIPLRDKHRMIVHLGHGPYTTGSPVVFNGVPYTVVVARDGLEPVDLFGVYAIGVDRQVTSADGEVPTRASFGAVTSEGRPGTSTPVDISWFPTVDEVVIQHGETIVVKKAPQEPVWPLLDGSDAHGDWALGFLPLHPKTLDGPAGSLLRSKELGPGTVFLVQPTTQEGRGAAGGVRWTTPQGRERTLAPTTPEPTR